MDQARVGFGLGLSLSGPLAVTATVATIAAVATIAIAASIPLPDAMSIAKTVTAIGETIAAVAKTWGGNEN